jgi:hypothetical protein
VIAGIFVLLISLGAIVAGRGYVRAARRMRTFPVARGTVISRGVAPLPSGGAREGRWGKGGGSMPQVTYTYAVDGVPYTNDRWEYAYRGLKHSIAQSQADAVPDEVDVHYNAEKPAESYLHTHTPGTGRWFIAGGVVGVLFALVLLLG